jgi:hypothetical protein
MMNALRIRAAASITPWIPMTAASSARGWPPASRQAMRTSAEPSQAATAMPSSSVPDHTTPAASLIRFRLVGRCRIQAASPAAASASQVRPWPSSSPRTYRTG